MGMANITAESIVHCTMIPNPYSYATRQAALLEIELRKLKDSKHGSESNLKSIKNDKLKGKHCKPFYQKDRW